MSGKPSVYESQALKQIHVWKNPELGWFGQAMRAISWPLNKAGDMVMESPGLGIAIKSTIQGIVSVSNDVAHRTVRAETIYTAFRSAGHEIHKRQEIFSLDLENVDRIVGWLDTKYKGLALVEGATTGALGAPGIFADIPTLITLNLRAIGEYATHYGFDVRSQPERLILIRQAETDIRRQLLISA